MSFRGSHSDEASLFSHGAVDFLHQQVAFIQPQCNVMFMPNSTCAPFPSPFVRGCCTPGYACRPDPDGAGPYQCQLQVHEALSFSFALSDGQCNHKIRVGGQCGEYHGASLHMGPALVFQGQKLFRGPLVAS